jgi:hypothetical protein
MERRLHLFWPLALIAAGILWLLIELGQVPASNLWALVYLWPLFLIGAGLGLILRPYWRFAGAVVSAIVIAVLFFSVVFAAQIGWNHVPGIGANLGPWYAFGATARGSGNVITENRDVKGFTTVRVGYPGSVVIRQGNSESLTIEAEDNVVAALRSEVVNGVLQIDNRRRDRVYLTPTKPVKITITAKALKEVVFEAAGDLTVQAVQGTDFRVELSGAGNVNLDNLKVQSLNAILSGAGSLHASGTADRLNVNLNGLGSFDGAALRSQTADIELDGLGSADVWVDKSLTADINGLGSVNYYGNAQVRKTVNGLGTVQYKGTK